MTHNREHREEVYRSKRPDERGWFQPSPELSLALIARANCSPSTRIIDVGGGTSRLVDALAARGYGNVTVLDIAPAALAEAKERLGDLSAAVTWIEADLTSPSLSRTFDLWHDRAVFHFLTEPADRMAYTGLLRRSLDAGGHAIIASFAEDGPTHCSGLPIVRYSPNLLLAELGTGFDLVDTARELHRTPAGREQSFVYCLFRFTKIAA